MARVASPIERGWGIQARGGVQKAMKVGKVKPASTLSFSFLRFAGERKIRDWSTHSAILHALRVRLNVSFHSVTQANETKSYTMENALNDLFFTL